ncbi:CHAT domain-containing protein [Streptomyces sp. HUAS TT20]|uniref:CHAT domain-containing protein n=1 Tax=Streptomyces sp. HUAS TT20 TaxID=3447509 RepID=UPI003986C3D6
MGSGVARLERPAAGRRQWHRFRTPRMWYRAVARADGCGCALIGTLWVINDSASVQFARTFYTELRTARGTLDTSRSALALHNAIHELRGKFLNTPSLWAAYLHAGA